MLLDKEILFDYFEIPLFTKADSIIFNRTKFFVSNLNKVDIGNNVVIKAGFAAGFYLLGTGDIYINERLFSLENEEALENTLIHEFCHAISPKQLLNSKDAHDKEWKQLMIDYKQPPIRFTKYYNEPIDNDYLEQFIN